MIELRSDTFTQPSQAMRNAMANAVVGNDDYGEDPTVARLEYLASERLGKEAGCLLPSGTMANLCAILVHAQRGTKIIVGSESDIYIYEAAGASAVGGIAYEPVPNQRDGTMRLADLAAAFPEDDADPQFAACPLICVENTQNRCGGVLLTPDYQRQVTAFARARQVRVHLDGARIFNAAVATGLPAAAFAEADSVQFCLSKGLSAPIGSVLTGTGEFVQRARRIRKMLGGGMRQAGVIAAAGIVALEEMVDRLADDHATARRLARGLAEIPELVIDPTAVQTNIVLFGIRHERFTPQSFVSSAQEAGVALLPFGHGRIRAVTHSGISNGDVDRALDIIEQTLKHAPI